MFSYSNFTSFIFGSKTASAWEKPPNTSTVSYSHCLCGKEKYPTTSSYGTLCTVVFKIQSRIKCTTLYYKRMM